MRYVLKSDRVTNTIKFLFYNYDTMMMKATDKERRKKYLKEYRVRPEIKEQEIQYRKEYNSRPKSKDLMKGRNKRYRDTHKKEIKEYLKKYGKKYYSRPEIKERQNAYYRQQYQKNKRIDS